MLSHEQVKKFQQLYKERFGKSLTYQEAYEKGMKLIQLARIGITQTAVSDTRKNAT